MASTIRQRLRRFNGTDYDTIHLETNADNVLYGDNTVKTSLDTIHNTKISKVIGPTGMASFNDEESNAVLNQCVVNIEPVQAGSGDPSPTNVRDISGWTGARVIVSNNSMQQITIEPKQSGSGDPSPTNIRPISPGLYFWRDDDTMLNVYGGTLDVITWTLTVTHACRTLASSAGMVYHAQNDGAVNYQIADSDAMAPGTWINDSATICDTLPKANDLVPGQAVIRFGANTDYVYFYGVNNLDGVSDAASWNAWLAEHKPQIVYPLATPVTYQLTTTEVSRACANLRVNASRYQISFGEVGTVYGGTLDVGTGILSVDRISRKFSELSITNVLGRFICFLTSLNPDFRNARVTEYYCSQYKKHNVGYDRLENLECSGATGGIDSSTPLIIIRDDAFDATTTAGREAFKTARANAQLVFRIATPVAYQLTPVQVRTLIGLNNIYADCGDITVGYNGYI